jgi:phage-related minor tail protein
LAQLSITNAQIVSALISIDLEDIAQGEAMHAAQVSIDAAITAQASMEAALTEALSLPTTGYTGYEPSSWDTYGGGGGGEYGGYGGQGSSTTGSDASTGGPGESLQHGGPVRAGRPYLVGEAGPELIIPRDAGTVVPNRQIREAMGGGGALNVIVNVAGSLVGVGSKDELIRYIMSGIRQLNRRLPGVNMFPVTG